jgi:TetR/AcrR family transcriptional regulator
LEYFPTDLASGGSPEEYFPGELPRRLETPFRANASNKVPRNIRNSEATQAEILNAAVEEFARHGLANARIEEIAAHTGVTKAMVYYYFNSKEELYQAVLERGFNTYFRPLQKLSLDQLPPKTVVSQK